jgi:transcriptional regulator with XRE-family HTH domain
MTQAALAAAAGTRERNIIRWENDQHAPRVEHIAAIAKATGQDVDFFLASESDEEDEEAALSMPLARDLAAALQNEVRRQVDAAIEKLAEERV